MVEILHSAVKGRARYRVKELYRSEILRRHIELHLSGKKGISSFAVNTLTGSILIHYNSDNTPRTVASIIETAITTCSSIPSRKAKKTLKNGSVVIDQSVPNRITREETIKRVKLRRLVLSAEDQKHEDWHLHGYEYALELLNSDKSSGLSSETARKNITKYGPNILPESVPRSGLSILLSQFKSLPVALLGAAAGISVMTGGFVDALVIMGVVTINAVIGYVTETQAEKTIHSLKNLVRPSATVLRDRRITEIGAENIVPGDILILRPGSYIAADARLIEATNLSVDESALTGESLPVIKNAKALGRENFQSSELLDCQTDEVPLADRTNMVYMGTLVTGGQGLAIVVATGRFTELGKIQTLVGDATPPETPMEKQLDKMGTQLVLIGGAVCGIVFIIGIIRGYGFLQMLKSSISLAVAAVPEGLPTVATTTLALGIRKMRKHNVLIRHLDAVETLGSVQTICLDKTGTITMNRMSVVNIVAGMRKINVSDGIFILKDKPEYSENRKIRGVRKEDSLSPYQCDELLKLIHITVLCNESEVAKEGGNFVVNGSPTENALIYLAISSGVDITALRIKFPVIKIQHRSENRNYMATLHEIKVHGSENHRGKLIAVKGSPNEVLAMCSFQLKEGKKTYLTDDDRLAIEIENERMAGDALRVLGAAYAFIDEGYDCGRPDSKDDNSTGDAYLDADGTMLLHDLKLVWVGLAGMTDPLRNGVKELMPQFHNAGIDTVMITGDQTPTAFAIGKELNLSNGDQLEILDSTHLADIDPEVMKALCEKVHVFARVSPIHKLQIVQALQNAGKVVAMTGDGINDGPALKAANIGIAMGHTGTDVAREVADVVLENDNMETMIIAISQGRTIYNNIRKSVHFLLSTNLSEIMVMFTSIATGAGHPLSAMQLLWINLMSDIAPGLALALEPPEPDVLSQPPRNPDEPIIRKSDFKRITFEAALLSAGSFGAYGYGMMRYGSGAQAGSMAFLSLTMGQLIHALSCRSEKHSIFDKEKLPHNDYLNAALTASFAMQGLAMVMPGLRNLLGITPLSIVDGFVVGGSAALPYLINEATKVKR